MSGVKEIVWIGLLIFVWSLVWRFVLWVGLAVGLFYPVYFLLTLPMRRHERARLFLDLLETTLKDGRTPEQTIQSISQSRDRSVGVRFHLLAAHLEKGLRLSEALDRVPRLLPPQVTAMLKVGWEMGDAARVLPACRQLLRDSGPQVLKGQSYLIVLLFVITPLAMWQIPMINLWVLPKFQLIVSDMGGSVPMLVETLIRYQRLWFAITIGLTIVLYAGALLYLGGPRVVSWLQARVPFAIDGLFYRLPWRRKRMQRDFSAMLALLLDAGLPEEKAVLLAAQCTTNSVFQRRAQRVVAELRQGVKLTEAVRHLDDAGEFRWRLTNAARGEGRFRAALAGWQEALDAKAFQQEQAAAHGITTACVLWNGAIVAITAWWVFGFLTNLIWEGTMW